MSRKAYTTGIGPKRLAAAGQPAAVQALRLFRTGFSAADGYDLRKYDTWTPQRKAAVTRAAKELGTLLGTPDLRIVDKHRYKAANNAKIAATLAPGQRKAYRVHFIHDPTHGTRPIEFSKTGAALAGTGQPKTITGQVLRAASLRPLIGTARKEAGRGNPVFLTWQLWGSTFNMLPGYRVDKWSDITPIQLAFDAALEGLEGRYRADVASGGLYAALTWQ